MPVSVQTPEDVKSKTVPSTGMPRLRQGVRVAAVLAAIGGMTSLASGQDTFDGGAGNESDFNDPLNWLGDVDPGTNLGGETILFDLDDPTIDPFTILVSQDIFQVGDLDNTVDNIDIVFNGNGVGTFEFIGGATIDPGSGSFTFDLDVTALGDLNFALADGDVTFEQRFTTNGGIITADGGVARFNGTVDSGAGTTWAIANAGGFRFDGQFNAAGNQTFNIGGGSLVFNGDFDATGGGTIVVDGGVADFNGTTTSASGTTWEALTGGFRFNNDFEGTGNQTFSGTSGVAEDDTFNFAGVTFTTNSDADQKAIFTDATFVFSGDVLVAVGDVSDYTFEFDGSSVVMGGLEVQTAAFTLMLENNSDLALNSITTDSTSFTVDVDNGSNLEVANSLTFREDDTALVFTGGGEVEVAGVTSFGARSSMTATGTTVAMDGATSFGDSFAINANGGAEVDFGSVTIAGKANANDDNLSINADDATVAFTGNFAGAAGISDITIGVATSGTGEVKVTGSGLRGFTSTFDVADNSRLVFGPQASGDGGTSLKLSSGSVVGFEAGGPTSVYDYVFAAVNGGGSDGSAAFESDLSEDVNLFIRGGVYRGQFRQTGTGNLSMNWAQGESKFVGRATTATGDYWIRNQGVHTLGNNTLRATVNGVRSFKVQQASGRLKNAFVKTAQAAADDDPAFFLSSGDTSAGALVIEGTSKLIAQGDFLMDNTSGFQTDPTLQLLDDAFVQVEGESTISSGTILLEDDSKLRLDGRVTSSGSFVLSDRAVLQSDSKFTQENGSIAIGTGTTMKAGSLVLTGTASLGFTSEATETGGRLILDDGLDVGRNATLFGNGEITLNADGGSDQLIYQGAIRAGAAGATTGFLKIAGGDVVAEGNGRLEFGIDTDLTLAVLEDIGEGPELIGQSSLLEIDGTLDLTQSGSVVMDVSSGDYVPSDISFRLITADSIDGDVSLGTNPEKESITRTWASRMVENAGTESLLAQYNADYTNSLAPGTTLYDIGSLLNTDFNPAANADPTGSQADLLGELDMISTAAAYQAALEGIANPTVQISAVQVAALSQYHDVLRNEIRRKFTIGERRTPTPFRLGESLQLAAQDDVAGQAIRRQMRPETKAQGFGAYYGRNLTTPTDGIIIGIDGNEYGGLGGFGWNVSDEWTVGVDLGYSAIVGDLSGGFGTTRVGTLRGGGFVTYGSGDGLFADLAISGGWNHYDFTRSSPGVSEIANSNADGFQIDTSIGLGYRIGLAEGFALTPTGSFLYSYINTGSIDESSTGPIAQSIDPGDLSSFVGRLGADVSWTALPGLVIDGRAGWQGNFTDNGTYNVSLVSTGTPLPVDVPNQAINTAYYGLGVNWNLVEEIDLNLRWEGRSGEGLTSQMFIGGVTIRF